MSRYREISALIFLVIFGILGVHQLAPHRHLSGHDKEDKSHRTAQHTHAHSDSGDHHHHHDVDQKETNEEGGLEGLLGNHTHGGEAIDFLVVTFVNKQHLHVEILGDDLTALPTDILEARPLLKVRRVGCPPPLITQIAFFITSYLRGPPQIV